METFTHVIITAPTPDLAAVYLSQLEVVHNELPCLRGCQLLCVADPLGVRIGSGGGTLNALHYLDNLIGRNSLLKAKVAIIHSGGDSKRAPFHTVCGKAWASINAVQSDRLLATPVTMLIEELSIFCRNILRPEYSLGSIVVSSSDVMLNICLTEGPSGGIDIPPNAVSVVGVPEAPEVAKNHGVLVGRRSAAYNSIATHYMQKPKIEEMKKAGAMFESESCLGGEAVYIDTGVVIFTGEAVSAFLSLLDDPMVNICTSKGIEKEHPSSAVGNVLPVTALRLELYSDMLCALALCDAPNDLHTYLSVLGIKLPEQQESPYISACKVMWNVLHAYPLHLIRVPEGMFCHLGTSSELLSLLSCCTQYEDENENNSVPLNIGNKSSDNVKLNFSITDGSDSDDDNEDNDNKKLVNKLELFSRKYSLSNFVKSSIFCKEDEEYTSINKLQSPENNFSLKFQGVTINSTFIFEGGIRTVDCTVYCEKNSLVEHSVLSGNFRVGNRSVVSHFPGFLGEDLEVFDGIMMQYVPVRYGNSNLSRYGESRDAECLGVEQYVVLIFSIDDDIKAHYSEESSLMCGTSWDSLFKAASVDADDIWSSDVPDKDRSLWNANIFPIASTQEYSTIFLLFLQYLKMYSESPTKLKDEILSSLPSAISNWKESVKLSLSDLLKYGNAKGMHSWKRYLQNIHDNSFSVRAVPTVDVENNLLKGITVSRCQYGDFRLSPPTTREVFSKVDLTYRMVSESIRNVSRIMMTSPFGSSMTSSSAPSALLGLWCFYLCLSPNKNNDKNVGHANGNGDQSTAQSLMSSANSNQTPYNLSDILRNGTKILLSTKTHSEDKLVEGVVAVFSELWAMTTKSPGSALLTLQYINELSREQDKRKHDMKKIIYFLLSSIKDISIQFHPRLFFIISWLLKSIHIEEKSGDPSNGGNRQIHENCNVLDLFLGNNANHYLPSKPWDASKESKTQSTLCFNMSNMAIVSCVTEWIEMKICNDDDAELSDQVLMDKGIQLSDILLQGTVSFMDTIAKREITTRRGWCTSRLDARMRKYRSSEEVLYSEGFHSELFRSRVSDIFSVTALSQESIATVGASAVIELVDWFDSKVANFFSKKSSAPPVGPKNPALGVEMVSAMAKSFFTSKSKNDKSVALQIDEAALLSDKANADNLNAVNDGEDQHLHGSLSGNIERLAQRLIGLHILWGLAMPTHPGPTESTQLSLTTPSDATVPTDPVSPNSDSTPITDRSPVDSRGMKKKGTIVVANAPVRIDLAGGWSDTPPICYETKGAVLNVAVRVDGRPSFSCAARFIPSPTIVLRSLKLTKVTEENGGENEAQNEEIKQLKSTELDDKYEGDVTICNNESDFMNLNDPSSPCVLLKAVCVVLGVVVRSAECGGCGLEIVCCSELPSGSGMGGSSILAAAALSAVAQLLGKKLDKDQLVHYVSQVEQVLTTGGGWQDQIGAIYGGFKIARSAACLPLRVTVEQLGVTKEFRETFERRTFLVFTGQQRLAKNTLIKALRKCAVTPLDGTIETHSRKDPTQEVNGTEVVSCNTVSALVEVAECGGSLLGTFFKSKTQPQDGLIGGHEGQEGGSTDYLLDSLGGVLNSYWELKKEMADGSETPAIRALLGQIRPLTAGLSLCGAGAGGFAVVILQRNKTRADLFSALNDFNSTLLSEKNRRKENQNCNQNSLISDEINNDLIIYSVVIDTKGISTKEFNEDESSLHLEGSNSKLSDYLFM